MKGSKLLLFDKRLPGLLRFNLIWNLAFFLLEAYWSMTSHEVFFVVFMFFFAALFLWAVYQSRAYLAALPVEADKE